MTHAFKRQRLARCAVRVADRVLVDCPNWEDYKAVVVATHNDKVVVRWVDDRTWAPLLLPDETVDVVRVTDFEAESEYESAASYVSEEESEYESAAESVSSVETDDDEVIVSKEPASRPDAQSVETLGGWCISFGGAGRGVSYRDVPATFEQVFCENPGFDACARDVSTGVKPARDAYRERATMFLEFCAAKRRVVAAMRG